MSNPIALAAKNLSVTLAGKSLLRDISCQIKAGQLAMVIGQNGAGKSIFLQALHGLVPLSAGHVEAPPLMDAKLVFQKPILLRRSTSAVFDFIAPNIPTDIRDIWLERAGLNAHLNHPARLLSGGQAQKLMLVAMLATQPKLLFLDEPTAHLDYESTDFVEDMLKEARSQGITIIMSSHNRAQVARLADQVLFLDDGVLVEDQPAASFFDTPQHAVAQRWLDYT